MLGLKPGNLKQAEIDAHKASQDSLKRVKKRSWRRDKIINDGEKNALAMSQKLKLTSTNPSITLYRSLRGRLNE